MDTAPQTSLAGNISGPYDSQHPALDKTYTNMTSGKYQEVVADFEKPKSLSDLLQSQGVSAEFRALDMIFDWHDSKEFITKCKDCNIYSDVAPFKETAVINTDAGNQALSRTDAIN